MTWRRPMEMPTIPAADATISQSGRTLPCAPTGATFCIWDVL